jgi:hypothetical protein
MGCSHQRAVFSGANTQPELQEMLKHEREYYEIELNDLKLSNQNKITNANQNNDEKARSEIENSQDYKRMIILQEFVNGVIEVETSLNSKTVTDLKKLGTLLENYFDHADDKENGAIRLQLKQITNLIASS